MARVGRGRSRGGRTLDIPPVTMPIRGVGTGRAMIGRGCSLLVHDQFSDDLLVKDTVITKKIYTEQEAKDKFLEELTDFVKFNKGSVVHITLKYFNISGDAGFFVDKFMEFLLKSSNLVEKFTMSYKLITLMKTHGENIKLKMFSKLQSTFQEMQILMKDCDTLDLKERETVRNFCDLLGQFFFRFRVAVDSLQRYDVFAVPVIECLRYLAKAKGRQELKLLAKLISFNLSALNKVQESRVDELLVDVMQAFLDGVEDNKETTWLLSILQLLSKDRSSFSQSVEEFFAKTLEKDWLELPRSRIQMLADIPPDIVDLHLSKFDINVEEYTKNRFVSIE